MHRRPVWSAEKRRETGSIEVIECANGTKVSEVVQAALEDVDVAHAPKLNVRHCSLRARRETLVAHPCEWQNELARVSASESGKRSGAARGQRAGTTATKRAANAPLRAAKWRAANARLARRYDGGEARREAAAPGARVLTGGPNGRTIAERGPANAARFALQAGLGTENVRRALASLEELEYGGVIVDATRVRGLDT